MKIELKLDENCSETKVIIIAEKMTGEISALMQRISEEAPQKIAAFDGGAVLLLDPADIVSIYAAAGKVFAVTDKKEYVLRLRLYEAEEKLTAKGFVRISNSEIINIKSAKKFDLSTAGTICVSLSNGGVSFVSRRYVTKIKKNLGI
ncbi:MAG: LytTR family transcriptional regulator [Clostridia bacterium]|nr:LytTR family transcriptional regulator [Clostridia bacterium]